MFILPKALTDSVKSLSKAQWHFFFHKYKTKNPEIYRELQNTPQIQSNSEKKNIARDTTLPNFKVYFKAIVSKTP